MSKNKNESIVGFKKLDDIVKKDESIISKYVDNLVVLYNIRDKKPFYYMSSVEARQAMQYIQDLREEQRVELDYDSMVSNLSFAFKKELSSIDFDPLSYPVLNSYIHQDTIDVISDDDILFEVDLVVGNYPDFKLVVDSINMVFLDNFQKLEAVICSTSNFKQNLDKKFQKVYSHDKLIKKIFYTYGNIRIIGSDDIPENVIIGMCSPDSSLSNMDSPSKYYRAIYLKNKPVDRDLYLIAACCKGNKTIGLNNSIPWSIKGEQKQFKEMTSGHIVIMGRNTYDSIGRPLPNRFNFVLTRNKKDFNDIEDKLYYVSSLEEINDIISKNEKMKACKKFLIGGEQAYRDFLPYVKEAIVSEILIDYEGDSFLPDLSVEFEESERKLIKSNIDYEIVKYLRKN